MDGDQLKALEKLLKEEREKRKQEKKNEVPVTLEEPQKETQKQPPQVQPRAADPEALTPEVASKVLESLNPRDVEVAADTFNPSALFEDKSQAEWFGNIVANVEADAIRAMHAAANKIPRWVWILVLAVGAMIGFIAALWLMGGLAGHATSTSVSTQTSVSISIPPPPVFTTTTKAVTTAVKTTTTTGG
jgi:hypothetical protein